MPFSFNLLVSTPRNFERDALAELDFLITQVAADSQFNYGKTIVQGLVWGNVVDQDPVGILGSLKKFIEDNSFPMQYILKVVPVHHVVETTIAEIVENVKENVNHVSPGEKFKVEIKKRRITIDSMEFIEAVADCFDREVDLESPDKIIRLEVIGKYTGLCYLKPDDVFSLGRAHII